MARSLTVAMAAMIILLVVGIEAKEGGKTQQGPSQVLAECNDLLNDHKIRYGAIERQV